MLLLKSTLGTHFCLTKHTYLCFFCFFKLQLNENQLQFLKVPIGNIHVDMYTKYKQTAQKSATGVEI